MNASKLLELVSEFESYYLLSPSNTGVHLGCDCGCSGDSYSYEEWEIVHEFGDRAYRDYKEFCEIYNIEWDYD